MYDIEQTECIAHLVRLQPTDEVEFKIGMAVAQRRPFRAGLVHAIFTEYFLTRRNDRRNGFCAERLRNRNEGHAGAIAPGVPACGCNPVAHRRKRRRNRGRRRCVTRFVTRCDHREDPHATIAKTRESKRHP